MQRLPPSQRRTLRILYLVTAIMVAAALWVVAGPVAAAIGAGAAGLPALFSGRLTPKVRSPRPESVRKPVQGGSPDAKAKRRQSRLIVVVKNVPMIALTAGASVVLPPAVRPFTIAYFLVSVCALLFGMWLIGGSSAKWDRRRQAVYDRRLRRLREDERWYEQHPELDPALRSRRGSERAATIESS